MNMRTVTTKEKVTRKAGFSMRTIIAMLVGGYMLLAFSVPMALAFTNVKAKAKEDLAEVRGKGANPGAVILWEGAPVGMAKGNGDFKFKAPLPSDCTGLLSDGVTDLEVTVKKCTPAPSLKVIVVKTEFLLHILGANTVTGLAAVCPEGTVLTGGGVRQLAFRTPPPFGAFDFFVGSSPILDPDSQLWVATFFNPADGPATLDVEVQALCASIEIP